VLARPRNDTLENHGSKTVDRKWWVLLAIRVGSLLGSIDSSLVNAVLPIVRRSLGSNVATIE
jgi:hypothetical protein